MAGLAGRVPSPGYVDPAAHLTSLPVTDEPLETTVPAVDGPADLVEDSLLAMDEMSSDAVRHGRPPVALRLWTAPGVRPTTPGADGAGSAVRLWHGRASSSVTPGARGRRKATP